MADGPKINVKKTGRVREPNLADPQLRAIGDVMVAAQKARWDDGLNADGLPGKKLSKRYFFIKRKYTRQVSPIRDMKMTGDTLKNFALRKAANGVIRAENTTRETRRRANKAQDSEQMIGLSGSDQVAIFRASQLQYGILLQKAWVPIG
jgi:hypothetical protein